MSLPSSTCFRFFFFNAPAPSEIYTLSLHDALPIFEDDDDPLHDVGRQNRRECEREEGRVPAQSHPPVVRRRDAARSEEHTSELQSRGHLVCRLLLEKKKKHQKYLQTPRTRNTTSLH